MIEGTRERERETEREKEEEEEYENCLVSLTRTLILQGQGSTLMTSFNLNCFLTPNTAILVARASL